MQDSAARPALAAIDATCSAPLHKDGEASLEVREVQEGDHHRLLDLRCIGPRQPFLPLVGMRHLGRFGSASGSHVRYTRARNASMRPAGILPWCFSRYSCRRDGDLDGLDELIDVLDPIGRGRAPRAGGGPPPAAGSRKIRTVNSVRSSGTISTP